MRAIPIVSTILLAAWLDGAEPLEVLKKTAWISDKEGTMAWIGTHRQATAHSDKIGSLFGKLTVSFTDKTVTTSLDGRVREEPNRILGQTAHEIASITHDALLDRDVIVVVEVDPDERGYWVYNSQFDIKEHFVSAPR